MFYITDYIVNKVTLQEAIQAAIDDAGQKGGGTVFVPAGDYPIVTLQLRSNITLYLDHGTRLIASGRYRDYHEIGCHHTEFGAVTSVIYALNCHNVAIEGSGTIHLSGDSFYDFNRPIIPDYMTGQITPEQITECAVFHENRVNQPVFFGFCSKVLVKDVTIEDSPCWTITCTECSDVRVEDLIIRNSLNIPNNDGLHFCGCNRVRVHGCHITSGGDCIAISSITNWDKYCENITISDCILKSCAKAILIGYMHSMVRNIVITNVIIENSNRGICLMANKDFGLIENVSISNCVISTRVYAGNWWGNGEPIFLMATPHNHYGDQIPKHTFPVNIQHISMSNIQCISENAIGMIGDRHNISGITMTQVRVQLKESQNIGLKGMILDLSPSEQTETIPPDGQNYTLVLRCVTDVRIDHFQSWDTDGKHGLHAAFDCSCVADSPEE